jgi:hypothetical protein
MVFHYHIPVVGDGSILKFGVFCSIVAKKVFPPYGEKIFFSDFTCHLSRRLAQKVAVARRTALLSRKPVFVCLDLVAES